jgi:hypothetical protein
MPMELIHTSAPHGIDANARGFTVVAMSQGLGGMWKTRLESLSSYSIETGVAGKPVIFRHVLLRVGGSRRHVLSRISPCGLDYTGRENRIAHHLLLDPNECPGSGPGWLLQQDDLFCHQWDRDPIVLGSAPILPDSNITPSVCSTWKEVTGDAGHAGHVLRHLQREDRKPLVLVLPNGIPPLTLFAEAIALLDPADRWTATFTTLVQKLPSDAECAIQIAIAGTETARAALAHPGMLALAVTSMPACPEDAFTQAAREGTGLPAFNSPRAGLADPHKKLIDPRKRAADSPQAPRTASQAQGKPTLQQQPVATGPIELFEENVPPAHNSMGTDWSHRVETPTKQSPLPWILAGVSIALVVILGAALLITTGDSGIPAATGDKKEISEASGKSDTGAGAEIDSGSAAVGGGELDTGDIPDATDGQKDKQGAPDKSGTGAGEEIDSGSAAGGGGELDAGGIPAATGGQEKELNGSVSSPLGACLLDIKECNLLTESECEEKEGLWDSDLTSVADLSISVDIQSVDDMQSVDPDGAGIPLMWNIKVLTENFDKKKSQDWYVYLDGDRADTHTSHQENFNHEIEVLPQEVTENLKECVVVLFDNKEKEVIGFGKKTIQRSDDPLSKDQTSTTLPFDIEFTEETEEGDLKRANWKGRRQVVELVSVEPETVVSITPHNVADTSPDYSGPYFRSASWEYSSDDLPTLILKQEGKTGDNKKYTFKIKDDDSNTFFTIRVNEKERYTLLSEQQDEKDISRAKRNAEENREEGLVDKGGTWNKDGTVCTFKPPPGDSEYDVTAGSAKPPRSPDSPWETVGDSDDKWEIEHDEVRWELSRKAAHKDAREDEYKWELKLMDKNPNHYPDEPIMLIDQHGRCTYELEVPPILPFEIGFTEETEEGDLKRANWKGRRQVVELVSVEPETVVSITPHNVADTSPDYSGAYSRSDSWEFSSDDLPTLILKQEGKTGDNKKYTFKIRDGNPLIFFTILVDGKERYTLLSKQQDEKDISRAKRNAEENREEGLVDKGGTWNKDGTVCTFKPPPGDSEYDVTAGSAKPPRSPDSQWETVGDSDDKWEIKYDKECWELSRVTLNSGRSEYQWKLELKSSENDKDHSRYPDEYIMLIDQHGRCTYELKVPSNNKSTEAEETQSSPGE